MTYVTKHPPVIYVTEEDVQRLLPMGEAVRLLRDAFADWASGLAGNQVRRRMFVPNGPVLHSMAGWQRGYFGTKVYSTLLKHPPWFWFHLFSVETGRPLAQFEANHLGQIRTSAASAIATDLAANPDARILTVIGSGFQARGQVEGVRTVRPSLEEVRVWSRNSERRERFAKEMGAVAYDTPEAAVRDADIVCTATNAKEPVLDHRWLKPGAHINAMGSNNPRRRELPAELVEGAGLVCVDSIEACLAEAGDLLMAKVAWNQVKELSALPRCWEPKRITVFKSVGLGLEDVAVAAHIFEARMKELAIPAPASPDRNPATH